MGQQRSRVLTPLESECQATIIAAAKLAGWLVHAEPPSQRRDGRWTTSIQGDVGYPDITMTRGAQLWFVELKRKPNKVSLYQQQWLDRLSFVGPNVHVQVLWVPEEMDAFIKRITRLEDRVPPRPRPGRPKAAR